MGIRTSFGSDTRKIPSAFAYTASKLWLTVDRDRETVEVPGFPPVVSIAGAYAELTDGTSNGRPVLYLTILGDDRQQVIVRPVKLRQRKKAAKWVADFNALAKTLADRAGSGRALVG